ncbi:MAG: DUF1801 domain-containing protein [Hyphomonadaceae bacterium]|nr:MAG: hypothetical protein FD160_1991 [Caulobacteraceae bacterium]MBT9447032.1 DUF1801 domain-containing protein [Hyphomonadaceae bacterium]TPW06264.1 MAG: hypothetical protein FD124_1832 [Alphaproteobacteria bacterium]
MATEPKTKKTTASVTAFIDAVENETRRADAKVVLKMMKEVTGEKPAMWGPSIIGFGSYKSPTGDWPIIGFSPRKANLVLYVLGDFAKRDALMAKLGKHKTGKACLYLNKLADVDEAVLREIVTRSVAHMRSRHG